ncbi:desmoplakin-like isoform X1 [Antennarius striatus]|uniref:desmoplakin-like isoform X1 n=1 Tax=Antennarius striatus TaxID=241820 RepID=UPI0035ADBD62
MSVYGSQKELSMSRRVGSKGDLSGGVSHYYARSEVIHGGGNGYDTSMDGYNTYSVTKTSMGGMGGGIVSGMSGGIASGMSGGIVSGMSGGIASGMSGGIVSGMSGGMSASSLSAIHQKALMLQSQCQDYLKKAEYALQSGSTTGDAERFMAMAKDTIEQLKSCAVDLRQMGQPNDNVVRTMEMCKDQLKGVHKAFTGSLQRRRSNRGSSGAWEEPGRSFQDAMGWIAQQKRLIETAPWGDDPAAIDQQLISHQKFHSSIQRSPEVDRARDDLIKKGDKANLHALDQEWDSLQKMSFGRSKQLQDLQQIIQEISREIMWVNEREEQELMFDWGDKNINQYIPRKQESYSKLMSALEVKEKDLNKLKARVDSILKNDHPASDKIEAYRDTLQTQWSWLLQITKCIDTHLKENAAYSQFFKEANETYSNLQKEHETVRKKFTCDRNTSLADLLELLKGLEREKEKILENKRLIQPLVNSSKNIVRLKPRNPEDKSSGPILVKALCDFKQDQKVICKGDEAILKNNNQRSKWEITGPGGLDMSVPSVCLIIPPPNPLSISLANKNDQYYEAILSIWNQLYINVKSLIAWQYCVQDITYIKSLTISMLSKMRPEEYRQIIKTLETHMSEFKVSSLGSQMFADDDKRAMEDQFTGAQSHYDQLVVQLPTYIVQQGQIEAQQAAEQQHQQQLIIIQQQQQAAAEEEARRLEEEQLREELIKTAERKAEVKKEVVKKEQVIKKDVVKVTKTEPARRKVLVSSSSNPVPASHSLTELHALRLRLEAAEGTLSQHVHICVGDDGVNDCSLKITQLETVQHDVDSMREEFLRLRERILKELDETSDLDKAQFLRSEIGIINQRLGSLESSSSAYLQRLRALRDMLESVDRAEDIVKVHEARLTEKETTSLLPGEVEAYISTLTNMKAELDNKKDVLASMEAELSKASHWNSQVGGPSHRCDMMLCKYTEQVGVLSDRWRRITGQIDTRLQDLLLYQPQLLHYKETSSSLDDWINDTRNKQDVLQATKIDSLQALQDHMNDQKALNSEIKAKRETVESVLKDNEACVNSIKDYEMDLASYTFGLETLLNIPIKRTMLRSPSMDLNQEAIQLQTRYMALLTSSGDYYKFLGELLKNMEELKIRNTRIDLLEEELRLLKDNFQDCNAKNKSLADDIARYKLELSQSQEQLLSVEEVKQSTVLKCNAAKESLDSTQSQLADLNHQVTNLKYLLEEEKRKKRLAEERYTQQQVEYDSVLRKRQKELETVSWSKVEIEKGVASKDREIQQLRRQLAEEADKIKELQREMSKVRSKCVVEINNLKLNYESQIHISRTDVQRLEAQREEEAAELQLQFDGILAERSNMEEELRRLRILASEAEERRKIAEEKTRHQHAVISEETHKRRELEREVEVLMRHSDEESNRYREELAAVMKSLQEKSEEMAYITHSLEEEARRRRTVEEGQGVMDNTLAELQVKLTSSSVAVTQLVECKDELEKIRLELDRESRERRRMEQKMSRLQGRMKDLLAVRDGLESQVENLRQANQDEVARRQQVETELEKTASSMKEYTSTITMLRQSQDQASFSEKIRDEEFLKLQEELERSFTQNKTSADHVTKLGAELKALQQQLLQEQARVKDANLKNEGLNRTIEESSKALQENSVALQRLKELTETQTRERLRMEGELRAAQHDKQELARSKLGIDDEFSSQIAALELQLQASERSNKDHCNLVSELSSEREKLHLETDKLQKQASETTATMQSLQSQYKEIVVERDALLLKLQFSGTDKDHSQKLEEELALIKFSQESELRNKQRLLEENERVKKDLDYWKEQHDSKQSLLRQYDVDKERLEREKKSFKSEIDRLRMELREVEETYKIKLATIQRDVKEVTIVRENVETELTRAAPPPTLDATDLIFDGVRKSVTANQLLECGVLDKPTFNQLVKGHRTVPDVSVDKRMSLKGTGPIAGVVIEGPKGPGSITGLVRKMTFTEAKKGNLLTPYSADLLLDAQAATGHIIDPRINQKFTVEEACNQGVVDEEDRKRLLAAEAAAVGYMSPGSRKPLSVFQAMKKGEVDRNTTLRLLQAQESTGGFLDPTFSVFLPKEKAMERNLIDDDISHALNQRPELYQDPDTEEGVTYMSLKRQCKVEPHTGLLLLPVPEKVDPSELVFNGVRKPVTAKQLVDCGVLDKPTFKDLELGKKTVTEVSVDKKISLKGMGPIAGVVIEGPKGPGSITGPLRKMTFTEAKKGNLLTPEAADQLLDAQAATGHIIDPRTNQKLTVEEACNQGVVDEEDRERLLAAESAAVGYMSPGSRKPLSVFQAMKRREVDKNTTLRLLQAQESAGGFLDPILSVYLPKDKAMERNLIDDDIYHALNQRPELYRDPDTEEGVTYMSLKRQCKVEPHTGLLLLPVPEKIDPSELVFNGVRKPVTAKQLVDCGVLDKPTFKDLELGKKTVPEVSVDKKISLKGTGPIAGVVIEGPKGPGSITGPLRKMTFTEAKKGNLLTPYGADILLDAQAATGHIIDPRTNRKFTVEEACNQGVVDEEDRERLLAAEAAAVGYMSPGSRKPLSVFQAMKKGEVDRNTTLRLLQAQESTGGFLDPTLSVFLPKEKAMACNLIDDDISYALNRRPELYQDPDTEEGVTYMSLKRQCKVEPHTGLLLLPVPEKVDPSELVFNGVRKPVTAKQLVDCGVLDKPTFKNLEKGKKTIQEVSVDKNDYLKGTGPIAGVVAGNRGKMSLSDAKKQRLLSEDSADLLLEAQAATGHIIDPKTSQKLTVEEACSRGVVDFSDRDRLLAAEAAAVGYNDPTTAKPLSVFEAMKRGVIDRETGLRLLQAQESMGGILDPNISVFLPKDTAIKRDLLNENLRQALNQNPNCYIDPETELKSSYGALKKRCKREPHSGLLLLPISETLDPSKLIFDGVRKPVTAQQLLDRGVLDKVTFNKLLKGEKTVREVSVEKKGFLKGTGSIAGVAAGPLGKMSLSEAKKKMLMPIESANMLLDAQAATGYIIDPSSNQKLTVDEACSRGVVDNRDRDRLLVAEGAAVGYRDPSTAKPLTLFEAMKKGIIDWKTTLRLLQAQLSAGGILDPHLSVFLPKETAVKHNLLDEDLYNALSTEPEYYIDPDTELDTSYTALKRRSKTESHTGLILLPIIERKDPSKLMFDGVRKQVSAKQLFECGVLDKPTYDLLLKGEKTVRIVSVEKKVYLKGTGPIAGVVGAQKMSLSKAKKQKLLSEDSANLLLDAQAATGYIIDPETNRDLTVDEACARGVVDITDRDRLLAAEAAAVGYKDPSSTKSLSLFEAIKKGLVDRKTGLRLLQAQEAVGGILDPHLGVFLPKDAAIRRNLLDEDLSLVLKQSPAFYLDPETKNEISYGSLKEKCSTELNTGLQLLPISKFDPSNLMFDGIRKTVTAQQLLDRGVLDKVTFNKLLKGEKTVREVSVEKMVFLKGTGSIAGVAAGPLGKMSLSEAKKKMLMSIESANMLLDAQAATGYIIDPSSNQKLTVDEACSRGVVDNRDRDRLLVAEGAAVGYRDPSTAKPLTLFEAMKKGIIDWKTTLRLLQAQLSAGGILDPHLSVFLPKETAVKHNLLDEDLYNALSTEPACYIDPDTELDTSYTALKRRSKTEYHTGLILLPIIERKDPSKLMFDGVHKPVSAQQLFECGVLDKSTYDQLLKGEKTVRIVSVEKKVYLKGTGPIAGVVAGQKMSLSKAKKQKLLSEDSANLLLEAQAATGHIIDPETNQNLTVHEACARGVVDIKDRDRLLAAEAAAVGYKDPSSTKSLSLFEAIKKGLVDRNTGLRLLQAQEAVGGILDPHLGVFLPKDAAIRRNLLDEDLSFVLKQTPAFYLDPETVQEISYGSLKKKCSTEHNTGLQLLPISKFDPSNLIFEGIRKTVTAQQLHDCGMLDNVIFNQLLKGEKTVREVSVDAKVFLNGTGPVAGVAAGPLKKISFSDAKKQRILSSDSANLLLEAQAATGHIIDLRSNRRLTVKEACARGVVDKEDESNLLAAEAAAIGYRDPSSTKLLSTGQAMKKGLINKNTALRLLQAQEAVGGILDPDLGIYLPKDIALDRGLIDEDLYDALSQYPECYLDPDTHQKTTYISLKKKCKVDPSTGLLLLPQPKKPLTVQGLRDEVEVIDLVDANLLERSDVDQLREGTLTSKDIEDRLRSYLRGSTCIAGVYDEDSDKIKPIYQAMKDGLLQPGTTLALLEAQAASGFIVDPVNNLYLTVSDAYDRGLFGPEFKSSLLSAERAVTGYKLPGTDNIISLFQAIERGLVEKGHGIRLLEAQIASGGIIDPKHSHRVDVNVAYKRGYFNEKMNIILTDQSVDSKGFFDPNTDENLTYMELKKRCMTDGKTGLILLPIMDNKAQESFRKNTLRKRRVVIVDPETNKEMTVYEAYNKGYIDYSTYLELSEQECEWEEITITDSDGSTRFVIIDRKTGRQYDITELLEKRVISQADVQRYRSRAITLTQFAALITGNTRDPALGASSVTPSFASSTSASPNLSSMASSVTLRSSDTSNLSSVASLSSSSSSSFKSTMSSTSTSESSTSTFTSTPTSREMYSTVLSVPLSPTFSQITTTTTTSVAERSVTANVTSPTTPDSPRNVSRVSLILNYPVETVVEQEPVGAIFDTEALEKITITEALNRGLVDSITALRLLEAQACTGGIIDPRNGQRFGIQEASRLGIIDDDMVGKLKPAQKAYIGFEDVKTRKKLSIPAAMKEMWLPYEAGQRFMEFQFLTGGLYDPEMGCRRNLEDAMTLGWMNPRTAHKLQDVRNHVKILTCPKSKLKISYKEALDNCMLEESTGVKMLQASTMSSRGISSPYNVASAPGSRTGSRPGSRRSSRRSSVDLGSPSSSSSSHYSKSVTTKFLSTAII